MSCSCGQNCGGSACGPRRFTTLDKVDLNRTIVNGLIPVANDLRDMMTQFGLRAYEVRVVVIGWTGGKRGSGDEYVKRATVILPTPKVADLTTLEEVVQSIGVDEFGAVRVSEINPNYTEDQLRGRGQNGEAIAPDEELIWEIEYPQTFNRPKEKRRFTVRSAPSYNPGRLQWQIDLDRARAERERDGRLRL